jgi:membrane-associated phospholipid phosphatase
MGRILTLIMLISMLSPSVYCQYIDSPQKNSEKENSEHMYNIKPWIDIPATVVFAGVSVNGFRIIYGRDSISADKVLSLNRNDVNSFDRPVTYNYSEKAKNTSDLFFYGSMPLPLLLYLDKNVRKDGLRVGLLYVEALGFTGVFYTTSAMIANRYRPITYNPDVPMSVRTSGGNKNSFPGGHPALVATSTFFMAKVYCDYHPNMRGKWALYTVAGGLAATTAYLRFKAGYHFKTDLIAGVAWGALTGVLVPQIHKNKSRNKNMAKFSIFPNYQNGSTGFTAFYKLNRDKN